jgi:tetratricopeptide (TPR) repeat protein
MPEPPSQATPPEIAPQEDTRWVDSAGHVEALRSEANALFDTGKFAEAFAVCDRVLTFKADDFAALNTRGLALENLGRFDEALAAYDRAIAVEPACVEARYNRANVLADLQRLDEALGDYEKVAAARPDFVAAIHNRAIVLEQLGRLAEALAAYENVLAISPDHAGARESRHALLAELGRPAGQPGVGHPSASVGEPVSSAAGPARPSAKAQIIANPAKRSPRVGAQPASVPQDRSRSLDRTKYFLKCSKCGKRGEMLVSDPLEGKAPVLHSLSKGFKHMPSRGNADDLRVICSTCQVEVRY